MHQEGTRVHDHPPTRSHSHETALFSSQSQQYSYYE